MRLLITGFTGFVSRHFLTLLNEIEPNAIVLGVDKNQPDFDLNVYEKLNITFKQINLLNKKSVEEMLIAFLPNYILHLASVSSVSQSWQAPLDSFVNNTTIFLNLMESIRTHSIYCRILSVGSSEEYGKIAESELPVSEQHPTVPESPYGVARVSQEMLSRIYTHGYGMDIIMTRSFNHIGPGQKENFVISSFAKQLIQLQRKNSERNSITTGDISVIRDFLDVRDVVNAYYLLLKKGTKGEIYNICSGKGILLKDIIYQMANLLTIEIKIEINPALIRPDENKKIVGSYKKIKDQLNWSPKIAIQKSLIDILDYWSLQIV